MNEKTAGIILSISAYREADVLMQVLCKPYGIISLVGRSSRKVAGRNSFLPLCVYEFIFDYREGKSIFTARGHKLLYSFFEDGDMEMMAFKNLLSELTLKNRDIDAYDELLFAFQNMDKDNHYLLGCLYLSFLIKKFGITPAVDGCVLCGEKKVVTLSNYHGGFLCIRHRGSAEALPVEVLRKFRLIIKASFADYEVLKDYRYVYDDFRLLMDFFLSNADLKLPAYDFYRSIV